MNWSLLAQLRLGSIAGLILALGIAAASWFIAVNFRDESVHAYDEILPSTVQIAEARSALWELRLDLMEVIASGVNAQERLIAEQNELYGIIETRLDMYRATTRNADERRALTSVRAAYERYKEARPKFFELWQSGQRADATAWAQLTAFPFGEEASRAFDAQIALQRRSAVQQKLHVEEAVRTALALVSASTVVLLVSLSAGYWTGTRTLRRIRALRQESRELVRRHLGEELADADAHGDEVISLVNSVRLMADRLTTRAEELRRAQQESEQYRKRLEHLLAASPAVIYAARADGNFATTFVSSNVTAQFGYVPEEFIRDPAAWVENVHSEDRERVLGELKRLLVEGWVVAEYRFRHKDGTWRWMHDTMALARDAGGTPVELVGCWIDITLRKQAEANLQQSEARFRSLVESAPQCILLADRLGRIVLMNAQAEKTLGYRRDELLGLSVDLLVPERLREAHARLRVGYVAAPAPRPMGMGRPLFARRKDGTELAVEVGLTPLQIAGCDYVLASLIDVTERQQARAALDRAHRMRAEFLANITHELRTPLNSVVGFAELLHDGVVGPLNAQQTQCAADILAGGQELLTLIEAILELSRLDDSDFVPQTAAVAIHPVLEERVAGLRPLAEERGITMTLDGSDGERAQVDQKALTRIFGALLENAIKFNRDGGRVEVSVRRVNDAVDIAVADTGIGIAPQDIAKLSASLVQLDAGLARKYGGLGLGLALAQRLAEANRGSIEIASEPGQGSTFTLRLPAAEKV